MTPPLIALIGPSGCGKTTIIDALCAARKDFNKVIGSTTRKARTGEVHGVDYFFRSTEELLAASRINLLHYCDNYYAIEKSSISHTATANLVALSAATKDTEEVIEVTSAVAIGILPESIDTLIERILGRGEPQEVAERRIHRLEEEIEWVRQNCDKIVINRAGSKGLECAIKTTLGIINGINS